MYTKPTLLLLSLLFSVFWLMMMISNDKPNDFEKLAFLDVPDIVKSYGYQLEEHTVTTDDGYILTIHRIPHGKHIEQIKEPVILQHGIAESSASFIIMGPNNSLAYSLADAGYDVWIGNQRGNYYSNKHVNLSTDSAEFWNFDLYDAAIHDNQALIDYILNKTGYKELAFIGYSFGGAALLALTSEKPEYNDRIKIFVSLAGPPYMTKNLPLVSKIVFRWSFIWEKVFKYFGVVNVLQRQKTFAELFTKVGFNSKLMQYISLLYFQTITGTFEKNINKTSIPLILGHVPAGTSRQAYANMGQCTVQGEFVRFDYGEKNVFYYGSDSPPKYKFENFRKSVVFLCGEEDQIVHCEHIERMFSQLLHVKEKYMFILEDHSHMDFNYGIYGKQQWHKGVIQILENNFQEHQHVSLLIDNALTV